MLPPGKNTCIKFKREVALFALHIMNEKILFVEDEQDLGSLVQHYLETKGFVVDWHTNAKSAYTALKSNGEQYCLCLLDIQMPGKSGFDLAENISALNPNMPFIFLTARGEKKDRLRGLDLGAVDYITKPFDIDELVLQLRNIIKLAHSRSRETENEQDVFLIGDIKYDKQRLTLACADVEVTFLTLRESELLEYFIRNKNKRIRKEDILINLWGENDYFYGRSLDVFISRLRKIMASSKKVSISNVYGVGYVFNVTDP